MTEEKDKKELEGARELVDAKAYEVSLVDRAANLTKFLVIKTVDNSTSHDLPITDEEKQDMLKVLEDKKQAIESAIQLLIKSQYAEKATISTEELEALRLIASNTEAEGSDVVEALDAEISADNSEESDSEELLEALEKSKDPESYIRKHVSAIRELSFGEISENDRKEISNLVDEVCEAYRKSFESTLGAKYKHMLYADLEDLVSRKEVLTEECNRKVQELLSKVTPVSKYKQDIKEAQSKVKDLEQKLKAMNGVLQTSKQVQELLKTSYPEPSYKASVTPLPNVVKSEIVETLPPPPHIEDNEDEWKEKKTYVDWSFED